MTRAESPGAVFTVRRSLWAIIVNLAVGGILAALTIANLVHQARSNGGWGIAVLFVILALFFLWQGWMQFRDRAPVVEISPEGMRLRSASAQAIPWSHIQHVRPGGALPGFGSRRVDVMVDAETFMRLKLGQRFLGDVIVKKRGAPNAFSVITPQLEENGDAIVAAVRRYWPPPDRHDDDE